VPATTPILYFLVEIPAPLVDDPSLLPVRTLFGAASVVVASGLAGVAGVPVAV
jgi:hypothetical protein